MDSSSDALDLLVGVLALAAATVTLLTTLMAALRPARLHREERTWRELLEVTRGSDAVLVRRLHRHTTAQIIARRLVKSTPGSTAVLFLGMVLLASASVLFAEILTHAADPKAGIAILLCLAVLIGGCAFVYVALNLIAGDLDARNRATTQILEGSSRPSLKPLPRPRRGLWLIALTGGVTAVACGLAGALWCVVWLFPRGMPYFALTVSFLLIYLVGVLVVRASWRRLVASPPAVEDHPPVSRTGDHDSRHPEFAAPGRSSTAPHPSAPPNAAWWWVAGLLLVARRARRR